MNKSVPGSFQNRREVVKTAIARKTILSVSLLHSLSLFFSLSLWVSRIVHQSSRKKKRLAIIHREICALVKNESDPKVTFNTVGRNESLNKAVEIISAREKTRFSVLQWSEISNEYWSNFIFTVCSFQ